MSVGTPAAAPYPFHERRRRTPPASAPHPSTPQASCFGNRTQQPLVRPMQHRGPLFCNGIQHHPQARHFTGTGLPAARVSFTAPTPLRTDCPPIPYTTHRVVSKLVQPVFT
ncbi:hypothetical protein GALMADRAFT_720340 [Galerina marginata CBS 339.88]|uniref:Uncharacterized protein n=1 Tax=Galerina marginata (strain CBS 339.88) TaxID=685588 RepID=A0A067U005_GALM3|nr:hypothetical protein GALMADRAFT_720340 [Galerina marginata CBS 339.88]